MTQCHIMTICPIDMTLCQYNNKYTLITDKIYK
jgi:hypothetical protein